MEIVISRLKSGRGFGVGTHDGGHCWSSVPRQGIEGSKGPCHQAYLHLLNTGQERQGKVETIFIGIRTELQKSKGLSPHYNTIDAFFQRWFCSVFAMCIFLLLQNEQQD